MRSVKPFPHPCLWWGFNELPYLGKTWSISQLTERWAGVPVSLNVVIRNPMAAGKQNKHHSYVPWLQPLSSLMQYLFIHSFISFHLFNKHVLRTCHAPGGHQNEKDSQVLPSWSSSPSILLKVVLYFLPWWLHLCNTDMLYAGWLQLRRMANNFMKLWAPKFRMWNLAREWETL